MKTKLLSIILSKNKKADLAIVLFLLIIGFVGTLKYLQIYDTTGEFYQSIFAPAVMAACDKGFVNIPENNIPALRDFLNTKTKNFDCKSLPQHVKPLPLTYFQKTEVYLLRSAAIVWRLFGVSWPNLYILNAILLTITLIAVYGIMRLGMGCFMAFLGTITFLSLSRLFSFLLQLRDFCIAPFILLTIFFVGLLIIKPLRLKRSLLLAGATGATVGIGLGFRPDLLIYLPFFIVAVLLFSPSGIREKLGIKTLATSAYLLTFLIFSYPAFVLFAHINNFYHILLLGLSSNTNKALNVTNSPVYNVMYGYTDYFVSSVLAVYGYYIHHVFPVAYLSKLYGQLGGEYFWYIIKNFPADYLTRIFASIWNILSLPFVYMFHHHHHHAVNRGVGFIRYFALGITVLAIFALRQISLRLALFVVGLTLFFGAYPVLQYQQRHIFYLTFIGIWMFWFLIYAGVHYLVMKTNGKQFVIQWKATLLFFAIPMAIAIAMYSVALGYQNHNLKKLFARYQQATLTPINVKHITQHGNQSLITLTDFPNSHNGSKTGINYGYLVVKIAGNQCDATPINLNYKYKVLPPANRNSSLRHYYQLIDHDISVKAHGKTLVFFPIYNTINAHFTGVDVNSQQLSCIKGFYQVKDVSEYPLQLILQLPQDWQSLRLHQFLAVYTRSD